MYQIKDKIYADAGCILKHKNKTAYNFRDVDMNDISEIKVVLDDMTLKGKTLVYFNGLLKEFITCKTYGD